MTVNLQNKKLQAEQSILMQCLIALCLFLLVFYTHSISKVIVSTDSMWSIYLAQSLINDGDFILDEYKNLAKKRKNYGLRKRKGELYSYFPVGTAIMATPFVWVYNQMPDRIKESLPGFPRTQVHEELSAENMNLSLQRSISSVFVALTVVIIFYISLNYLNISFALIVSLLAAFCSPLWSTASRGLWQHGPSALLISLSILLILKLKKHPQIAGLSGMLLAFAYVVRPTNAIALLCFGGYLALNNRQAFRIFILSALLIFIPFIAISYDFFNRFLPPYYSGSRLQIGPHFPIAFISNLFSPNRGLFFLSPLFIPALFVMLRVLFSFHIKSLSFALMLAFFGHLTAISLFPEWWGGHAFGPRYMTETIPYVIFFFVLWLKDCVKKPAIIAALALAACFSFFVHYRGADVFKTFMWNVDPENIDRNPSRVWSFSDLQFLR